MKRPGLVFVPPSHHKEGLAGTAHAAPVTPPTWKLRSAPLCCTCSLEIPATLKARPPVPTVVLLANFRPCNRAKLGEASACRDPILLGTGPQPGDRWPGDHPRVSHATFTGAVGAEGGRDVWDPELRWSCRKPAAKALPLPACTPLTALPQPCHCSSDHPEGVKTPPAPRCPEPSLLQFSPSLPLPSWSPHPGTAVKTSSGRPTSHITIQSSSPSSTPSSFLLTCAPGGRR